MLGVSRHAGYSPGDNASMVVCQRVHPFGHESIIKRDDGADPTLFPMLPPEPDGLAASHGEGWLTRSLRGETCMIADAA